MTLKLPTKLYHYSDHVIEKLDSREYTYSTHDLLVKSKPTGLWFSVEDFEDDDDQTWKTWCIQEDFNLEYLTKKHKITLKQDAQILHISNLNEFNAFEESFITVQANIICSIENGRRIFSIKEKSFQEYSIDWIRVIMNFQGIIIAPYLWERRLGGFLPCNWYSNWYYGWDCASGCIWDINCIESFTAI